MPTIPVVNGTGARALARPFVRIVTLLALCLAGGLLAFPSPPVDAQESLPLISIEADQEEVVEGGTATFTLTRSGSTSDPLTVRVYTDEPRHPEFQAFVGSPVEEYHSVTFTAGSDQATLTVTVDDDGVAELDNDFLQAEIDPPPNPMYRRGYPSEDTVTIRDPMTVTIAAGQNSVTEGGTANFTLTRIGSTEYNLAVNVSVSDPGSFLRGNHWEAAPLLPVDALFAAESDTATISLQTKDDWRDIENNVVSVELTAGEGYQLGGDTLASVTVMDDDVAPELELVVGEATIEEGATTTVKVRRVGPDATANVELVVESGFPGQMTKEYTEIEAGESELDFTVFTDDNDEDEAARSYEYRLLRFPEGYDTDVQDEYWTVRGPSTVTVTVTDNDLPVVGVEAVQETRSEGQIVSFRFIRKGDTTDGLNIRADFSETTRVVAGSVGNVSTAIGAGETTYIHNRLAASGDGDEPDGSLGVRLLADDGYRIDDSRATAVTQILDTDPPPTLSVGDSRVSEDGGVMEFVVTLSAASGKRVTVDSFFHDGTAEDGLDYTRSEGLLIFQPGQTSRSIPVPITDDDIAEVDETITLTLNNPSNVLLPDARTSITVTGTIEDDEPVVSIAARNTHVTEGETAYFDLTRTGDTESELTVHISVFDFGQDEVYSPHLEVTFPAGDATTAWEHPTTDDEVDRADFGIGGTVISPGSFDPPFPETYRVGEQNAVVTVKDNDLPTVTIEADHYSRTEGETVTFTLTREGDRNVPLTVNVSVTGGDSFITGTRPTTVKFEQSESTKTLTLTTVDDDPEDERADVTAAITAGSAYTIGSPGSAGVTLFDSEHTYPEVSIRAENAVVAEGDDVVFTLTRSAIDLSESLTVQVQVLETGWDGSGDVDPITGSLLVSTTVTDLDVEFEAGSRTATLTRSTVDETFNDGNSRVAATIKLGFYAIREGTRRAEVWVRDDDLPTVTVDTGVVARVGSEVSYEPFVGEELTYTPRTLIETGFEGRVEDPSTWSGIVLSRTGDTTNALLVRYEGFGISWSPDHVWLSWGRILVNEEVVKSGPGRSRYYGEVSVEQALDGTIFISQEAGSSRGQIFPGDSSAFYTRSPHGVGPLGGVAYYAIRPFYCETVPGDCGYEPQYQLGTSTVASYRVYNDAQGVRVEAAEESVTEGEDVTFTLHRYGGRHQGLVRPISVKVQVTQNGEFIEGVPPQTVTFAGNPGPINVGTLPGELSKTVTISTANDDLDEADGAITLTIIPLTAEEEAAALLSYEPEIQGGASGWSAEATVAVLDDDELGFSIADAEAPEGVNFAVPAALMTFTVALPAVSTLETSVDWATAPDADGENPATPGVDYESASGSLTFAPGETSKTITVRLFNDDLREEDETFLVELSNPVGGTLQDPTATGTITNDDFRLAILVTQVEDSVVEGQDAVFQLTRHTLIGVNSLTQDRPRSRLVVGLEVTQDGDFISGAAPTTAVFEAGQWTTTVAIPTVDDDTFEADGSVSLKVKRMVPELHANVLAQTVTVRDNDIILIVPDVVASEGDGEITFRVHLYTPVDMPVTVDVTTVDGTATSHGVATATDFGRDFVAKSETLTFAPGIPSLPFTVALVQDQYDEAVETFTVKLSNPVNVQLPEGSITGTIRDDDAYLVARLVPPARKQISEDTEDPVRFVVELEHDTTVASERNVQVEWQVTSGTATHGDDYVESGGVLAIPTGQTSGVFGVELVDDSLFEAKTEDFTVALIDRSPDTGTSRVEVHADKRSTVIQIRDDERLEAAIFADASTVNEGEAATFTVQLSGASPTAPVEIDYETAGGATSGEDYTTPSGMLTIPAGQQAGVISITTIEDGLLDPDETLKVKITGASSLERELARKKSSDFLTILDPGTTSVAVEPHTVRATEGDALQFQVTLSVATVVAVDVHWETREYQGDPSPDGAATPDVDYPTSSGTVTIPAESTSATFTVATTEDSVAEPGERLQVVLTGATTVVSTGGNQVVDDDTPEAALPLGVFSATGIILDDDDPPTGITLSVSPATVAEDAGETELTVTATLNGSITLSVDTQVSVMVSGGTATESEDYTAATAMLTIPAGQMTATGDLSLTPVDDDLYEKGGETVQVTGTASGLEVTPAEVTITDNDSPPTGVILSVVPNSVTEGTTKNLEVTAEYTGGSPFSVDAEVMLFVAGSELLIEGVLVPPAGPDDFTLGMTTNTLVIPAGARRGTGILGLTTVDDSIAEGDETLQVRGAIEDLNVQPATVTITDDDREPTGIELSVSPAEVNEDAGPTAIEVTATLTGGGARIVDTEVSLSIADLTATAGLDYSAPLSVPLTIPAGTFSSSEWVSVTLLDDSIYEGPEQFAVRGSNNEPGLPVTGVRVAIADNDTAPTAIVLTLDKDRISESAGLQSLTVTATLQGGGTRTVETAVALTTSHGTTDSSDYSAFPVKLSINAGEQAGTAAMLLAPIDDSIDEGDETLKVRAATAAPGFQVSHEKVVTITDDDEAGVTVSPDTLNVYEGGSASYTVVLNTQPTADVAVTIGGHDDTDVSVFGTTLNDGEMTFTPDNWDTPQAVTVQAYGDDDAVADDAITLTHAITGTGEYADVAAGDVTVTITEDDTAGVTIDPTTLEVTEGDAAGANYTVVLDTQPSTPVTVTVSGHADTDLTVSGTNLFFTSDNWYTPQTVTVTAGDVTDDTEVTLSHTVSGGDYGSVTADDVTVTIINEDPAVISIAAVKSPVTEGSDTDAEFTLTREGPTSRALIVNVTITQEEDFTSETGQKAVTFTAGEDTATLKVPIDDDQEKEFDGGTITATVDASDDYEVSATAGSAEVRVLDDDALVRISWGKTELTVAENVGQAVLEIVVEAQRDGSPVAITDTTPDWLQTNTHTLIGATARGGVDFTPVSEFVGFAEEDYTLESGRYVARRQVSITIIDDIVDEGSEYFDVQLIAGPDLREILHAAVREFATAKVTITDNDDAVWTLAASPSEIAEAGGTSTVTVSAGGVSFEDDKTITLEITGTATAGVDYTVTTGDATALSAPYSLTLTAGEVSVTANVTAEDDDQDEGDETVLISASLGSVRIGTQQTVTITNDDAAGVSIDPTALTVLEGGSADYTVVLDSQPSADVTVAITGHSGTDLTLSGETLSDDNELTFTPDNWNTAQTVTVTASQDDDAAADPGVTLAHAVSGSGEYADVTSAESVTVIITDDDEAGVHLDPTALTLTEGQDTDYTVVLATEPSADVMVAISGHAGTDVTLSGTALSATNGLTFTPDNWNQAQTVTVAAGEDVDASDDPQVTLSHAVISTGDYADVTAGQVTVNISDNDLPRVIVAPLDLDIPEGSSRDYTVVLNTQPTAAVAIAVSGHADSDVSLSGNTLTDNKLTFTTENWDTTQTITVAAAEDDDAVDDEVRLDHAVTGGDYQGLVVRPVIVAINDNDETGVNLSRSALTVVEGASGSYTLSLASEPTADVVITISGHAGTDITLSGATLSAANTLTFTPDKWNAVQTVTVTAAEDDDATGDPTVSLAHEINGTGEYADVTAGNVTVTIDEDDEAGVDVNPTTLTVLEGDATGASYTVKLDTQPTGDVTVTINGHSGTDIALSGTTLSPTNVLTFTPVNWNTAQTVTVSAAEDDDAIADAAVTLTHTVRGGDYAGESADSVTVAITENDTPTLAVSNAKASEAAGMVDFEVTLSTASGSQVTVDYLTSDGTATAGTDYTITSGTLTFPAGSTDSQTISVPVIDDTDDEKEEETFTLTLSRATNADLTGGNTTLDATGTIRDNDDPQVTVSFGAAAYDVDEGTQIHVPIALSADPERRVVVQIALTPQDGATSDDYIVRVPNAVFTAGVTAKTVRIQASHDEVDDDGESVILSFTNLPGGVTEGSVPSSTVNITDDDAKGVTVSPTTLTVAEGGSETYTVILDSEPTAAVAVTVGGQSGDVSANPTSLTFTTNNWGTEQTVTVSAAADDDAVADPSVTLTHTVSGGDYDSVTADGVTVTVTEKDTPTLAVGDAQASEADGTVDFVVTLSTASSEAVTVDYATSGGTATAGQDYTATSGTLTFPAGSTASQTISVPVTDDMEDEDEETFTLTLSGAANAGLSGGNATLAVTGTITDDDVPAVTANFEQTTYTVAEGSSVTITLTLSAEPERTVSIPLTTTNQDGASNSDHSGVPASLAFNSGETTKSFTFTAAADDVDDDDESVKLAFGALPAGVSAGSAATSTVTITDDDTAGVSIDPAALTVLEGSSKDYTVVLATMPSANVTVTISGHAGTDVTLSGATLNAANTLTFTPDKWNTAQTVTLTAGSVTADTNVTLTHAVSGGGYDSVAAGDVIVTIIDVPEGQVTIQVGDSAEPLALEVPEGGSNTYALVLGEQPSGNVTVTITVEDTANNDISTDETSLAFTMDNWNTPQAVTVSAAHDDDANQDPEVKITHAASGADSQISIPDVLVTITEDDTAGVTVDPTELTVLEGSSKDYTVVLNSQPSADVTITVSGHSGTDITLSGAMLNADNELTFTSGNWNTAQTVTVTAAEDDNADDENFTITHQVSGYGSVTAGNVNVKVMDDAPETVRISFGQAAYTVPEGETVEVTATLDADPERSLTIPLTQTSQGGAAAGDYSGVPASVTFDSGDTEKSFTFSAAADDVDDDGESVKLAFGATLPAGVTEGATSETTVSITDDDHPEITVRFGSATYTANEGTGINVSLHLNAQPERTVEVTLTKTNQDGATAADYSGVPAAVTFLSEETQKEFTFTATADSVNDDGESVSLGLSNLPDRVTAGSPDTATVSITDDDVPTVTVNFEHSEYTLAEGGSAPVKMTLSADPERSLTIPIGATNQDGATGDDYSGVPENLTFASGDTEKTFTVNATDDSVDDDGESVKLGFGALPAGVNAGTTNEATLSITDNDHPDDVTVSFEQAAYTVEEGGSVTVTMTLSAAPERNFQVPITRTNQGGATDGDYTVSVTNVNFNAEDTSKTFTVSATDDEVDDDGESVKIALGTLPTGFSAGSINETVVSINDDDMPAITVSFEQASYTVSEGSSVTVKVKLSADPERAVIIPITTAGQGGASSEDYSGVPSSVSFASGETEKEIVLQATEDAVNDDEEGVKLGFGSSLPAGVTAGTPNEAVVSITDDDVPSVTVSFENATYTVAEGSIAAVKVTLSADPERTVTIPLTKANQGGASGSDYSGVPASLAFNSGETEKTITFAAAQDTLDDDGESVKLGFGNLPTGVSAGSRDETTISITDDDHPSVTVSFEQATYTVAEGSTVTVEVKLSADPERSVTIPLTKTNQGTATDADYSGVPASLAFASGDTEKTFTFTAATDSANDDGESVKLGFGATLPTGVSAGTPNESVVSITDDDVPGVSVKFGASSYTVAEGSSINITVALTADPERTVTIPLSITNQGETSDDDHSLLPNPVTFNSGQTSRTFSFQADQDSIDDDDESVKIGFGNLPTGVTAGTPAETTVSITDDDDPQVTVQFGSATYAALEGSSVSVQVTLSADPERTVTMSITADEQGGASSADYTLSATSLMFNAGDTEETLTLTATDDQIDDDGESVKLGLGSLPTGVTAGTTGETTVSITDDDGAGVTVNPATLNIEEGEADRYTVVLDTQPTADVTITVSGHAGTDITLSGGTLVNDVLTFTPDNWNTAQTVTVTASQDDDATADPAVTLAHAVSGTAEYASVTAADLEVTITENDVTVHFAKEVHYTIEGASGGNGVGVVLSAPLQEEVTIPLTVLPESTADAGDYTFEDNGAPADLVLTFGPGETFASVFVKPVVDMDDEDLETVVLGFGTLPEGVIEGSLNRSTVEILDAVRVSFAEASYTATEGAEDAIVKVQLNEPHRSRLTIPLTAEGGNGATADDWSGEPEKVTFVPGATSVSFTVTAVDDTVEDDGEMVKLGFGTLDKAAVGLIVVDPATATVTLMNREVARSVDDTCDAIWCGTVKLTHRDPENGTIRLLGWHESHYPGSSLSDIDFTYGDSDYTISTIVVLPLQSGETYPELSLLAFAFDSVESSNPPTEEHYRNWTLSIEADGEGARSPFSSATLVGDHSFDWKDVEFSKEEYLAPVTLQLRIEESESDTGMASTQEAANTPATGTVVIEGTPLEGQTLTADTSRIEDENGLTSVAFSYQWLFRDSGADTEIPNATEFTYTLKASDEGKPIRVRVSFTDDAGNEETLTSNAVLGSVVSTQPNTPATGAPAINGTARVGETLTADTNGIADADSLDNASFTYQWVRSDGNGDADIDGATDSTYTLDDVDEGKTLKVRVSFTDDKGNEESLTSEATAEVAARPNTPATGLPSISGTAQVGETLTADTSPIADEDGLTNATFEYQWIAGGSDINGATSSTYELTSSEQGQTIQVRVSFDDDRNNDESLTSAAIVAIAAAPNRDATGAPTISGTPQVDETLTADTSAISDEDGLANVSYHYQWLRDDADIAGQTNSTYRMVSADESKTIQVRVTFTDDRGNAETLTSVATDPVAARPTPAVLVTASFANVPPDHNGGNFTFDLNFSENVLAGYARIRDDAFTIDGGDIKQAQRKEQGSNQGWTITVEPEGNGAISITLPETTDCDATGAICTDDGRKLSHSTSTTVAGPPAISVSDATVQEAEGAVLVFTASLSRASSRTVTVDYATSDGSAQAGSDYTAASGTLTFNAGDTSQTVQVTVLTDSEDESQETLTLTFSNPSQATLDDATGTGAIENGESSSGTQEDPPAEDPPEETPVVLLTASFGNMPATHNGSAFTFDLTFSENVKAGYARVRDDAFTISDGDITSAVRKEQGSNQGWTITVQPDGDGAVTIVLPATTDCNADGAICTADGRKLSNRNAFTVSGPQ